MPFANLPLTKGYFYATIRPLHVEEYGRIPMRFARRFIGFVVRSIVVSVILSTILTLAIIHLFGESRITCTVDGKEAAGCEISDYDVVIGYTPFTTRFRYFGVHRLSVSPPKGTIATVLSHRWNVFEAGIGVDLRADFQSVDQTTTVDCFVEGRPVNGCMVEVNGEYAGETPLKITLEPGDVRLVIVGPEEPLTAEPELVFEFVSDGRGQKLEGKFTKF